MNEIFGNNAAHRVRSLILERLPLFLEYHNKATLVTMWLSERGNFVVRTFKEVVVTRSIDFAGVKSSISIKMSATTRRRVEGPIELWLGNGMQVDMYEIATSLGHSIFSMWKVHHALLLMTMLSSDLQTLQRRGFNGEYKGSSHPDVSNWTLPVNRILRQQEAERKAHMETLTKRGAGEHPSVSTLPGQPVSGDILTNTQVLAPLPTQGCVLTQKLQAQLSHLQISSQQLESEHNRFIELFATSQEDTNQAKMEIKRLKAVFDEFMAKHKAEISKAHKTVTGLQGNKSHLTTS